MTANPLHPIAATKPSMGFGFGMSATTDDVPPTPSIMSPRATEFTINPFARPSAFPATPEKPVPAPQVVIPNFSRPRPFGFHSPPAISTPPREVSASQVAESFGFATPEKFTDPVSGFANKSATPPKADDPRSPAMKGEAPIIRSIDDVL
jgi:hypothetical protein